MMCSYRNSDTQMARVRVSSLSDSRRRIFKAQKREVPPQIGQKTAARVAATSNVA